MSQFFFQSDLYLALFVYWRMGHSAAFSGRMEGWLEKVLPRDQSGVPLMVWKEGGRDEAITSTFLPPLGQSVVSNFLE